MADDSSDLACQTHPPKEDILHLDDLLKLTPNEQLEADQHDQIMALTRALNEANGATQESFAALMAQMGAIPIPEVIAGVNSGKMFRVKRAIQAGNDLNEKDSAGGTALHFAAEGGRLDMVDLLLACGADPNIQEASAKTAADLAKTAQIRERLQKR